MAVLSPSWAALLVEITSREARDPRDSSHQPDERETIGSGDDRSQWPQINGAVWTITGRDTVVPRTTADHYTERRERGGYEDSHGAENQAFVDLGERSATRGWRRGAVGAGVPDDLP